MKVGWIAYQCSICGRYNLHHENTMVIPEVVICGFCKSRSNISNLKSRVKREVIFMQK